MSQFFSLKRDLAELEQMTERIEDYLVGDKLFLPLAGNYSRKATMPQLTLGALLLRRRRLETLRSTLELKLQRRLDAALARHDAAQSEWTLHYGDKLRQEAPARARQMRAFFRDCQENPAGCAAAYPAEALRRTLVQESLLAMDEFGYDKRDILPAVTQTDTALRRILKPGPFIWSPLCQAAYPSRVFWWLYSVPFKN